MKYRFDVKDLAAMHAKLNEKYFSGVLTTPKFKVSRARKTLGRFTVRNKESQGTIIISHYWDRDDWDIEETMLHEMIHQWQWETLHKCDHLKTFRAKAEEINSATGHTISRLSSVMGCKPTDKALAKKFEAKKKAKEDVYLMTFHYQGKLCVCKIPNDRLAYFTTNFDIFNKKVYMTNGGFPELKECRSKINYKILKDEKDLKRIYGKRILKQVI